ncbi:MAG: hypothetical protein IJ385_00160 [Ruminiclostridium sp.]|nr:hypothetical protein [Ruminiclostridium sp.]
MELLCVLLALAVIALVYIMSRKHFNQKNDLNNSSTDNLKKYFGDDISKITGNSSSFSQFTTPVKKNSTISDIITPSDIVNRPLPPSNNALYGNNPINSVINKKMAGANLLGITINVERAAEMPKNPSEQLCGLISIMLAKGMGAAAKGNSKIITFLAVSEEESVVISCSYPEKAIPETDEKIRKLVEEAGGEFTTETSGGITTDKAKIPEKSN